MNYRYRLQRGKDMTYILGARCSDGVVLIGDTKIIRGDTEVSTEEKIIQPLNNVVVGASGVSGVFHKFLVSMMKVVNERTPEGGYTPDTFIMDCEDISKTLTERYFPRIRDTIEVLVALRVGNKSELYIVTPDGVSEPIKQYLAIGHGGPYGSFFLKKFWNKDLTMMDMAKLGCFIIHYIEFFELDNSVGGNEPQIWFLPDMPEEFDKLPEDKKKLFSIRQLNPLEPEIRKPVLENVLSINDIFREFKPF
ncbi:MAG: hypothetical protein V1836_02245 [Candidatus Aenigmatarchaeota archaeon]